MSLSSNHDDAHTLLVLYATETGNSQYVADRIARECRRMHIRCRVVEMGQYSPTDLINEEVVVFAVSTTGSGSEPRSMTSLWNLLLRSDLPADLFEDLHFAVFGLGDSAYEKYCWPAKKLFRRLHFLGAIEICEMGDADDQRPLGIDQTLDSWTDLLLSSLQTKVFQNASIIPRSAVHSPRVSLAETADTPLGHAHSSFDSAIVKRNKRITAGDWSQDVRHFELIFSGDIQYSPGDVAVIPPAAHPDNVEEFLTSMGWSNQADTLFRITQIAPDQSMPDNIPPSATLRKLFTFHLDFNAVPRRYFFYYLRHFTQNDTEKERLDEFLSKEGADELYDYTQKVRRTIREVLTEFRDVKIPLEYIFDVFPPLRPREFSIASSVKLHPRQIHLCIAIVKYRTKLKILRQGVCTRYLASLKEGDSVKISIKRGFLSLPPDNTPILCVGPGTGIAPMRAIIEERIHESRFANTLYFGCRHATKDQYYEDQWKTYVREEMLVYRTAFSRDGAEGEKRIYVQDLMKEDSERIWKLIEEEKAFVFISGSSNKMPVAVREALKYAAVQHGGLSEAVASHYVGRMEREKRLFEECWS